MGGEEPTDLVGDDFAADINHLDVRHIVAFFVVADTDVVFLVQGDALFEILEGFDRVLVFVVGTRKLQAFVCFEDL